MHASQQPAQQSINAFVLPSSPCTPSNSLVQQAHIYGAAKTRNILQYDLSLYENQSNPTRISLVSFTSCLFPSAKKANALSGTESDLVTEFLELVPLLPQLLKNLCDEALRSLGQGLIPTIFTHDVTRNYEACGSREEARQVQQFAAWGWAQHVGRGHANEGSV